MNIIIVADVKNISIINTTMITRLWIVNTNLDNLFKVSKSVFFRGQYSPVMSESCDC